MASTRRFDPTVIPENRPGPARGTRAQNRIERTASLCLALRDAAIVAGLDGVSLDQIASAAGITKPAIYRYFETKADIARALFKPIHTAVSTAFERAEVDLTRAAHPSDILAAYATLADGLIAAMSPDPTLVRLYLAERHGAATDMRAPVLALSDLVHTQSIRLTALAQARGWLRPIDPRISATAVIGAVHELLWRRDELDPVLAAQDAMALVALVLDGIGVRDGD